MQTLEADGLTRRFGDRIAVDALSFRVRRGEVLGFLGPNGAGKTTTFNLLSGLLTPDAGVVRLDGEPVALDGRVLRSRMGVVFQQPSLDLKLTARENLEMGGALYGLRGEALASRVVWGLALVELVDRADEVVERYSGGMRRRLELARVLLHEPEILLMDEPTQGLDVAAARRIWSQLLELRARTSLTILLTTHNPDEAEHCDRIVVLDKGKTIAEGSPSELRDRVGGDVVTLLGENPVGLCAELHERFGLATTVVDETVTFEQVEAHTLIPKLITSFAIGRIRSVSMRQASIGDVFLKLTGKTIDGADEPVVVGKTGRHRLSSRAQAQNAG